jgi:hypothetical protein
MGGALWMFVGGAFLAPLVGEVAPKGLEGG